MKKIQILGTGCAKCEKLAANAKQAAEKLGLDYELVKIKDLNEIMAFGVMTTPGLAVDGKVLTTGKLPSPAEIEKMIG
ncbi:small redox-active disulfide protein 2 [Malonomonas rubra DSM 5091]|uniref:Small redox-active disulfide protein 2 n=1 Tax=Malonomonas rubra DSM 5091 TaxID=1122189 RepID=A0A1M6EUH9_MALRU|nr:thioredoxin family protein [Malonomonas rubra]SHI89040.1 small redox-active disulfide protein 2 [Malonomonas rubra DSM 5091]